MEKTELLVINWTGNEYIVVINILFEAIINLVFKGIFSPQLCKKI